MSTHRQSRRDFLRIAAGSAGLVVGVGAPWKASAQSASAQTLKASHWISIDRRGRVTLVTPKAEMGQGVWTAWAMIVAEFLDVPMGSIAVVAAPADPERFRDPFLEKQATFGSTGIAAFHEPLAKAAAEARSRLVAAAALQLNVPIDACETRQGAVVHSPTGRRFSYGELVPRAAALPERVVAAPAPAAGRLIGTEVRRIDTPDKVQGRTRYGIDMALPGMRTAILVAPPWPGQKMVSCNSAEVMAQEGMRQVVAVTGGVALIARDFWSAKRARGVLRVEWSALPPQAMDEAALRNRYASLLEQPGARAPQRGPPAQAPAPEGGDTIRADYSAPFLAHLPMEPLNCTAHIAAKGLRLWLGTQDQEQTLKAAMTATGLAAADIAIESLPLGGGFGRRAATDFVVAAIEAAKAAGVPVKLVMEREDELRAGFFRPASHVRFEGRVKDGRIAALSAKAACASVGMPFWGRHATGPDGDYDFFAGQGLEAPVYRIPSKEVRWLDAPSPFPAWIWRGVGYSQNVFFLESFIDELALAAKADPLDFRVAHAGKRTSAVLEAVARRSGWREPTAAGRARGVAASFHHGLILAMVAEVSLRDGAPAVHRITAAIDAGRVINPGIVRAQVEGGVIMGLSEALGGGIRFSANGVTQTNFHDYPVLRMAGAPRIDVEILSSVDEVIGLGEFTPVPVAPAVANALAKLTGNRHRDLPLVTST